MRTSVGNSKNSGARELCCIEWLAHPRPRLLGARGAFDLRERLTPSCEAFASASLARRPYADALFLNATTIFSTLWAMAKSRTRVSTLRLPFTKMRMPLFFIFPNTGSTIAFLLR